MTHKQKVKHFCGTHEVSRADRHWLIGKAQEWDEQEKVR